MQFFDVFALYLDSVYFLQFLLQESQDAIVQLVVLQSCYLGNILGKVRY